METNKFYAFSSAQSSDIAKIMKETAKETKKQDKNKNLNFLDKYQGINSVNYYTTAEMKNIIGTDFSTAYFDAEYEKLALLERSQLNLNTVPTPLLEMDKYNLLENKGNIIVQQQLLREKFATLTPTIKLEKIGGKKAITLKYLYKQMNRLMNVDVSLMSANDRLYILTNINQDSSLYAKKAEKTDKKQDTAKDGEVKDKVSIKDILKQALALENVNAADVPDSVMSKFNEHHVKLVKAFSVSQPTKEARRLTFTDTTRDKTIVLPDDWYYAQTKYQLGEKINAVITGAGSVPEMKQAANAILFNTVADNFDAMGSDAKPEEKRAAFDKTKNKYLEEYSKAIKYLNSTFITTSFQFKDDSWKEFLANPESNKATVDVMLRDGLKRLKGFSNEYFALHDYSYKLDFTKEKANVVIDADFMGLKDYNFSSKLFFGCHKDTASLMVFVRKADFTPDAKLIEQINQWEF
ncbi:hypothetical protein [uncultured Phascolarctobacterium sp.]|uniref:hypothetical protein n=1 Tax=uncultured Phascolarctobacterium sp. TaxID=512296 RepID=UPI0025E63E2F|nr:hypothetical protein [uncultured Phascolarctobacterium sp.]